VLNLTAEQSAVLISRLRTESVAWITTVTAAGQPQSSPVWFLWTDDKFLIYAQPQSWKVRNVQANQLVSVHLNSDDRGGRIVTFEGAAEIIDSRHLAHEDSAYLQKYRDGIEAIGLTPDQLGQEYSTAILITPTRVRVY
jgi:PPOX class probable F420-dependent enzyme